MSFKKKMLTFAAVSALTAATAVPALALENEFHGMYKFIGYQSNFINGKSNFLADDAHSGFFAEQRARILYTAKANDNLKLVTHFELDSRFGGTTGGYKGITTGNDSGQLDADSVSLEVKNYYLDTVCPITGTNVKIGVQPWADSYSSLFLLADMAGVYATKKFDPFTASLGWFRLDDDTTGSDVGQFTTDLFVLDGKFAVNKDIKVGASYYGVFDDAPGGAPNNFDSLHMIGLNADLNLGPASVKPFAAYQFGKDLADGDINGYLLGATAKVKVGPGAVNAAAMYLSGDDNPGTGDSDDFKIVSVSPPTSYFNAANMWLLIRNGGQIGTSTSVLGNDITAGGRGTWGAFAGYEGTMDKLFYNANLGHMQTVEDRGDEDNVIGTEVNAQVGYKVYDNLSVSAAAAYAFLGDALGGDTAAERIGGANDADNPYLVNLQVSYVF